MALIKCTECGKEISDKSPACINCGCPVSEMKKEAPKASENEKNNIGFADFNNTFGQFFGGSNSTTQAHTTTKAAPAKTEYSVLKRPVPDKIPDMKLLPGIIVQILDKFSGVAGLAGFTALGAIIVGLLNGFSINAENLEIAALGILGNQIFSRLSSLMEFWHVKRYLKRNNHVDAIREDDASYSNSIAAFRLCKQKAMARYIKRLNPSSGSALEKGIKKGIKERRKKLLLSVPFMLILMAIYYLLPRLEESYLIPYMSSLIVCHVATFVIMFIYERKLSWEPMMAIYTAALFAPTIFAYFITEMWYHIAICAAAAFLGMLASVYIPKRKYR